MRRALITVAVAVLGSGAAITLTALPVRAASVTTNCMNLQTTLNGSAAGDVITLHDTTKCLGAFTLPAHAITLEGQTQADGFEGLGAPGTDLTGANVGATSLTNLTFTGGLGTGAGGAVSITGSSSPTISHSIFVHNHADRGGAVSIQVTTGNVSLADNLFGGTAVTDPNIAAHSPGAVAIQTNAGTVSVTGNTFTNNVASIGSNAFGGGGAISVIATTALTFTGNVLTGNQSLMGGAGGAATLLGQTIDLVGNTFRANSIGAEGPGNSVTNFGGGVAVLGGGAATLTQSHNLFDSNTVHTATSSGSAFDFGGGGEWAQVTNITSFSDTFINNHVDAGAGGSTAVGGGLAVEGLGPNPNETVQATDLGASSNSVGAQGEGGGIYAGFSAGCFAPPCTTHMTLADSTVDSNSVGSGGSGPGVAADPVTDVTKVVNSIVYGNTGTANQVVSGTLTVGYSDSCNASGAAYPGSGNICTDPKLANPAGNDLHETAASPSVDTGSNALIPAGLTVDFDGDARVQTLVVDMGADEFSIPVPNTGAAASAATTAPLGWSLLALGFIILTVGATSVRRRRTTSAKPKP